MPLRQARGTGRGLTLQWPKAAPHSLSDTDSWTICSASAPLASPEGVRVGAAKRGQGGAEALAEAGDTSGAVPTRAPVFEGP